MRDLFLSCHRVMSSGRQRCGVAGAPRKPSSVGSLRGDHFSGTRVTARLKRPTRDYGEAGHLIVPYLVLLRVGFTEPEGSPPPLVRSYRTVSPLPRAFARGGLLSVALSLGSLPLGVTQHPALWSSDFPRAAPEARPAAAWRTPDARIACLLRTKVYDGSASASSASFANSSARLFCSRRTCRIECRGKRFKSIIACPWSA